MNLLCDRSGPLIINFVLSPSQREEEKFLDGIIHFLTLAYLSLADAKFFFGGEMSCCLLIESAI
jgi:hypothetical protein